MVSLQLHGHRVSKGTSRFEKAHQLNVIPKSTAPYSDTRLMHILHSDASTPMGETIRRWTLLASLETKTHGLGPVRPQIAVELAISF